MFNVILRAYIQYVPTHFWTSYLGYFVLYDFYGIRDRINTLDFLKISP